MSIEVGRPTDPEAMDRLLIRGNQDEDWYIASSLNDGLCAEGSWGKWVTLATEILNEDNKRKIPGYREQQIIF